MIRCGFFDSVDGDRLYRADEMCRPYELLVSNGVFATPQGNPSTYLQVYDVNGMDIAVRPGRGIFKDKWMINDDDILLTVDPSEVTLSRVDSVVVRINTGESGSDARSGTILIKKGTPASSPVAPTMERSLDVYEYRLANITVGPQVSEIVQKDISDQRGSADCPWVTSLVQQVDTSTLFEQWQDAYERYYEQVEADNLAYYNSNKDRFDAYYTDVNKTFDDFYASNSTRFDTFYNNTNTKFNTLYNNTEDRFDEYYTENTNRFNSYYTSNETKFNNLYNTTGTRFDTLYNDTTSKFDSYYTSNSTRFDTYYTENDKRFDDYYAENQTIFNTWFNEIKSTAGTLTLVSMYSNHYVTSSVGETVIPINISQFNNPLDILQVYINGLLAVEGVDYNIASVPAESITLVNGVEVGTMISFNVIKSSDAVTNDSVIQQVAAMETKIAELEARIKALES